VTRTKYDAAGNPRFTQNALQQENNTVQYTTYDGAGRPLRSGIASGVGTFESLDMDGEPFEDDRSTWRQVRAYDSKPAMSTFPWSLVSGSGISLDNTAGKLAGRAYKSGGTWRVTLFSYDREGRVKRKVTYTDELPSVRTEITYAHDRQGRMTERHVLVGGSYFHQWYEYNERGLLAAVYAGLSDTKPSSPSATYQYTADGQVKRTDWRNGKDLARQYSERGWLKEIDDVDSPSGSFAARYQYKNDGNVQEAQFNQPHSGGSAEDRYRYTYSYDALDRLTEGNYEHYDGGWQGTGTSGPYDLPDVDYDTNGNIESLLRHGKNGQVDGLDYIYDDEDSDSGAIPNRLSLVSDNVGSNSQHGWDPGSGSFAYDAMGRMKRSPPPQSMRSVFYGRQSLPLSMQSGEVGSSFRHTAAGQRFWKRMGGSAGTYVPRDGSAALGAFAIPDNGFGVVVEEERSADEEMNHTDEQVGYAATDRTSTFGGNGEAGHLQGAQGGSWHTESLGTSYTEPVVLAGPLSYHDRAPAHLRLRNVGSVSFEWKIEEWLNPQDGAHARERAGYLVVETGTRTLDGVKMEAGKASTTDDWTSVSFEQSFQEEPVVLATVQTFNGGDPVVTRVKGVTSEGFEVRVQEEEARGTHTTETIGYLAVERDEAASSSTRLVVGQTANSVRGIKGNGTPKWHGIPLPKDTPHQSYVVLAHQQTTDGGNTAGLRQRRALGRKASLKYWNVLKPGGEVIGRVSVP